MKGSEPHGRLSDVSVSALLSSESDTRRGTTLRFYSHTLIREGAPHRFPIRPSRGPWSVRRTVRAVSRAARAVGLWWLCESDSSVKTHDEVRRLPSCQYFIPVRNQCGVHTSPTRTTNSNKAPKALKSAKSDFPRECRFLPCLLSGQSAPSTTTVHRAGGDERAQHGAVDVGATTPPVACTMEHNNALLAPMWEEVRGALLTIVGNLNGTPELRAALRRAAGNPTLRRRLVPFQQGNRPPAGRRHPCMMCSYFRTSVRRSNANLRGKMRSEALRSLHSAQRTECAEEAIEEAARYHGRLRLLSCTHSSDLCACQRVLRRKLRQSEDVKIEDMIEECVCDSAVGPLRGTECMIVIPLRSVSTGRT